MTVSTAQPGCMHATFHNNAHGGSSSVPYSSPVAKSRRPIVLAIGETSALHRSGHGQFCRRPARTSNALGTSQDVHAQKGGRLYEKQTCFVLAWAVGLITRDKRQPV